LAQALKSPARPVDDRWMSWLVSRVEALEWWRTVRYSAVSVLGLAVTQGLLLTGHAVLGLGAATANTAAVLLASVPVFLLNRRWVWQRSGRSSFRREVVPFWAFTIAGLVASTLAVAGITALSRSSSAVAAANITAFGVLWVAKYVVLDDVVFAPAPKPVAEELAAA
jgi:putative flippase GtrA